MDYSQMTDFEINILVAKTTGHKPLDPMNGWKGLQEHPFTAAICKGPMKLGGFDPCNSWSDAGPIIFANKITISAPMEYDQPADWLAYPSSDSDICISHPNPLRAAMTAFLVMQEAE
jgi:hypothetical protein